MKVFSQTLSIRELDAGRHAGGRVHHVLHRASKGPYYSTMIQPHKNIILTFLDVHYSPYMRSLHVTTYCSNARDT